MSALTHEYVISFQWVRFHVKGFAGLVWNRSKRSPSPIQSQSDLHATKLYHTWMRNIYYTCMIRVRLARGHLAWEFVLVQDVYLFFGKKKEIQGKFLNPTHTNKYKCNINKHCTLCVSIYIVCLYFHLYVYGAPLHEHTHGKTGLELMCVRMNCFSIYMTRLYVSRSRIWR